MPRTSGTGAGGPAPHERVRRPGRLLPWAVVAAVGSACLAGTATTVTAGSLDSHASRPGTVVILVVGAVALLLLAVAALLARYGSTRASVTTAWRAAWAALGIWGVGMLAGIIVAAGTGIRQGSAAPPLIALWTAAVVCVVVLLLHRQVRRALPGRDDRPS